MVDNNCIKVFDCNGKFLFFFCVMIVFEEIIKDVYVVIDKVFVLISYYRIIMDYWGRVVSIIYLLKVIVFDIGDNF